MKKIPIPPMLTDLVGSALAAMDGVEFSRLDACPSCGGVVAGHDTRKKRFAVILEDSRQRTIHVRVKRFHCIRCGSLCYADAPFYPDTRQGSPVVDLCVLLSARMPYHRAARTLKALGIVVDRGTVRNYARRDFGRIPCLELFGVPLPLSLLNLFTFGSKRGPVVGAEALAACGFPAAVRAALHYRRPPEERDQRDEEKDEEERKACEQ